ncbi:MAG: mechanosensitive ion channel protein MscS [Deltaproteobacteria bacterium]|nr:MAG: mechanosensitive ion channel protein MscS [Deltaproteobacteria bacterium]
MNTFNISNIFQGFMQSIQQIWTNGVFGVTITSLLIAIGIIVLSILLRKLLYRLLINRIQSVASATNNKMDDEVIEALRKPISYIPVVFGCYIAMEYLGLQGTTGDIAKKFLSSVIIFVLFWSFYNLVEPFGWLLNKLEHIFDRSLIDWLKKLIKGAFVFIGLATILEVWGIRIGPIIAGLGLFGVAVALGAQDLFKNLISGILVLAEHRFSAGDWIRVEGVVEGVVESIGFRSTRIRRFDKAPVFVPNAALSDNPVINFSAMTFRRISWTIGLRYDSTIDQLKAVRNGIEAYVLESGHFVHPAEAPLFVRIDKFNDSSIDMMLYCFTRTTVWKEWLECKEALALNIKKIVEEAGTDFAFPSQSVYVETLPEGCDPTYLAAPSPGRP